jgi:hypothetical protein
LNYLILYSFIFLSLSRSSPSELIQSYTMFNDVHVNV